jgi:transposase
MSETDYQSDVSDEQWEILRKLLPPASRRGRPPLDRRWVLNAILYVLWTGCPWRALPSDFPGPTVPCTRCPEPFAENVGDYHFRCNRCGTTPSASAL